MKKKIVFAFLAGSIICSSVLTACSKDVSEPVTNMEQTRESDETIVTQEPGTQKTDEGQPGAVSDQQAADIKTLADGTYSADITFEGGSGKAQILSPVTVVVTDGKAVAKVQWNSPNYDYMIVDGEEYLPVNTEGDSAFEIPVPCFDKSVQVVGDTVAMSKPREVEYTLTFHSETMKKQ